LRYEPEDFTPKRFSYEANGAREHFLSCENEDGLMAGFLRLRFPQKSRRKEITSSCALVRELHVYGSEVPINRPGSAAVQHQGLGAKLLEEAEAMAGGAGKERMLIISGVGVREYYRKHGYSLLGPYMSKRL
jgi:elongator complex protein 3